MLSFPRVAAARGIPDDGALHEMCTRSMDASGFLAYGSE